MSNERENIFQLVSAPHTPGQKGRGTLSRLSPAGPDRPARLIRHAGTGRLITA